MLVLTRKCLEVVVVCGAVGLDPLVKVTVLGIEKGKVRLGFEAQEDLPVHRLEVWEQIRASGLVRSPSKNLDQKASLKDPLPTMVPGIVPTVLPPGKS